MARRPRSGNVVLIPCPGGPPEAPDHHSADGFVDAALAHHLGMLTTEIPMGKMSRNPKIWKRRVILVISVNFRYIMLYSLIFGSVKFKYH